MPRSILAALLLTPTLALAAPSGCDDLSSIPITDNVDFETQIAPLIRDYSCGAGCHQPPSPFGGLDLNEGPSSPPLIDALRSRLTERAPRDSLLFNKLNCDDPGDNGGRMPFAGELELPEQALFYDWISQGARGLNPDDLYEVSDTVFRSGMESTRID